MATVLFVLFQVLIEYLSQSPAKSNNQSPGEEIHLGLVDLSPFLSQTRMLIMLFHR